MLTISISRDKMIIRSYGHASVFLYSEKEIKCFKKKHNFSNNKVKKIKKVRKQIHRLDAPYLCASLYGQ